MPDVAIVLGTYNRLLLLQRAIGSFRRATGGLSYAIIVVDGGSVDGTLDWLDAQPDVQTIKQELPLTGAVTAFNLGFAQAVESEAPFVVVLNDDDEIVTRRAIFTAVEMLRQSESVGAVAFETNLRGPWGFELIHGKPYANKGVFRREAGMAAARAAGDPEGKAWWSRDHLTYASDTELGCWIWRLGWTIERGTGLRVNDSAAGASDAMREANIKAYTASGSVAKYHARWDNAKRMNYSREDAKAFGGRILARTKEETASPFPCRASSVLVRAIRMAIDRDADHDALSEWVDVLADAVELQGRVKGAKMMRSCK
jgi:glycosyltransferase involved in cell wall biosynthesis